MPSFLHEALIELFHNRPQLAPELLATLGLDIPSYQEIRTESTGVVELSPTEFRADAVITLRRSTSPILAIVVETQLRRDEGKRWSWPVYLTTLRSRLKCPTLLLVICVDNATAAWCATPIAVGHPQWVLIPLVMWPNQVPLVRDVETAIAAPELAVLSAIAHAASAHGRQAVDALMSALATVEDETSRLYADVVLAALPAAARGYLEELMRTRTYEYQSDFARRYVAEGRTVGLAEGEAAALLEFLSARDLIISDAARDRIKACTDLDQLRVWIRRAATVAGTDELFN